MRVSPAGQGGKSKGKRQKAKGKNGEGTPLILHFCLFAFLTSSKAWESANSSLYQDKLVIVY
jgi:hypothetical protein